ncbi:MAG: divalent-cation tolerance protein CutA [Pseudomonadota bacterium]|nr:divalent-cation tolerance protein CutA [Pseudomonadota bacterium]
MDKDNHYQLLITTCPSLDIAQKLAHSLLKARLVACVNLFPQVQSIFEWQGEITTEQEVVVFIKTRKQNYAAIEQLLLQQHPYEVPELIGLPIETGLEGYLNWINHIVT